MSDRTVGNPAVGVVIFLLSVVVIVAPFASVRLPRVDAFLPVLQAVMCVVDIITAAFLFAQYSIHPKYALLAVASAYVFNRQSRGGCAVFSRRLQPKVSAFE
jgi:hypothetical protein